MIQFTPGKSAEPATGDRLRPPSLPAIDWPRWTRQIDRKRRQFVPPARWPGWVYRESTRASFRLDGIDVPEGDVLAALAAPKPALRPAQQSLRSRHFGRLRNHLAIQRSLDRARVHRRAISANDVVRWYTIISSGLSTANLSPGDHDRLAGVVRQLHSPQRRLQPAVTEAAKLYADLLADPMFPGFNGILARLLLHARLLNCGLPPVVFDPARDGGEVSESSIVGRLLEQIDLTLDRLGAVSGN